MGKVIDLLYDFYSEMKEAEEETEQMSARYTEKQQFQIALEYEQKIIATTPTKSNTKEGSDK